MTQWLGLGARVRHPLAHDAVAGHGPEATDGAFQGSDLLVDGTVAGSRASMLDAADPETLEDDFMYGLTHFRPYFPRYHQSKYQSAYTTRG